jgi:hypothetical protein
MKELTEAEKQVTTETHELHVSLDEKQRKLTEFRQTFECWWLYSSDRCLSCMLVWFDLDYRC